MKTPFFVSSYGAIYCGDALEIANDIIGSVLNNTHIIMLSDPMYGQETNVHTKSSGRSSNGKSLKLGENTHPTLTKDWENLDDSVPFMPEFWLNFDFNQYILFGAQNYASRLPDSRKWIVWDKRTRDSNRDDNSDAEMAWTYGLRGPTRIYRQLWKGLCRAGEENLSIQGAKYHPFQKPVGLLRFALNECNIQCPENTIVFDPYAGSCSTGVICERMGLRWVCIEKLSEYCEIGKQRIEREIRNPELFVMTL
jgi:DNA modification methylase